MIYRVKCTHCLPLLDNLKKYAYTPFRHDERESYIEVETLKEEGLIRLLEFYQEQTFKYYKELLETIGEDKKL